MHQGSKPSRTYLLCLTPILLFSPALLYAHSNYNLISSSSRTHTTNRGDCHALGERRRPPWVDRAAYRRDFSLFRAVYSERPVRSNAGGMLMDHSYALWTVLRAVRPRLVIESGAFRGQSTWVISRAMPEARVLSLDPQKPKRRIGGVEYMTEGGFRDFGKVDWKGRGFDIEGSVVLLDDHQSARRRIFEEGARMGFRRFVVDDNYEYLRGDHLSLRWLCETDGRGRWPGVIRDNFGRKRTRQSWEEHLKDVEMLRKRVKYYYEFPPVVSSEFSNQTRYNVSETSDALFTTKEEFNRELAGVDLRQFQSYTHFAYIEVWQ